MYKRVIVHRNGTDYGPYEPLAICEMLHKGELLQQDHARLENGTEWKSLETLLPEIIDRIVVSRGGTEYGPYDPYLACEMIDKGQLSKEDQARLEDGSKWKSLDKTISDSFDRSVVLEEKSITSKRALTTGIPLLICGYFAYQNLYEPSFFGGICTIAVFWLLFDYFSLKTKPNM
jgi:hypothetical protein